MGLGALLRRSHDRHDERALPPGALLTHPGGSGLPTWAQGLAGGPVDTDAALRLPAVWACVRLLADSVSTLPVDAVDDAGTTGPRPQLLREPAAGQPLHEWLYAAMSSLLLRGNAYGLITARTGPALWPAQVELVHPDLVGVDADPITGAPTYRIGGQAFGRDQVWHARAYVLPGVLLGMSPVEYARQGIALGLAAERYGAQFFGQGAVPSVVLTSDNPDLTVTEAAALKAGWTASQASRLPAVLNGSTRFEQVSIRPDEAQFLDTQRLTVQQIARVFGVPAEMIGGDAGGSLTYSNTEARALDFVRYSITPWLVRLEAAVSRLLPAGQAVRFNPDALLRGTTTERYAAHTAALDAGWMTADEVRAVENLPPLGDRQGAAQDAPVGERAARDLHRYWTTGAGLPRWQGAARPLLELYRLLARDMTPAGARAAALAWFAEVQGRAPRPTDGIIPAGPDEPEEVAA